MMDFETADCEQWNVQSQSEMESVQINFIIPFLFPTIRAAARFFIWEVQLAEWSKAGS